MAGRGKVNRLVSLLGRAPFLMPVVDHPVGIESLESRLAEKSRQLDVLLDIDVGHCRTGVPPGKALDLAKRILASPHLRLRGIQAYAGHVQHIPRYEDRRKASRDSLRKAATVFKQLQVRAESCTIFSASGTGTARIDLAVAELTESFRNAQATVLTEYRGLTVAQLKTLRVIR